jgi:hypothetical protein
MWGSGWGGGKGRVGLGLWHEMGGKEGKSLQK